MSLANVEFTRIVLGLDQRALDRTALRFAADFAKLLQLDLVGLFAEDPSLARLSDMPDLREFRLLEKQWRSIEGRSLTGDVERCVEVARRALDETARTIGVSRHFEVVRARLLEAVGSISRQQDIVMVSESRAAPHLPGESFAEIVAAALATPAAVLVVPSRIARQHGPILAISETGDDTNLASARAIAAAANERLTIIAPRDVDLAQPWPVDRVGERLIVMPRRIGGGLTAVSVSSRRRVPVLVLGHHRG